MVLLGAYRGQNLTGASFRSARLDGADLSGAIITEADFAGTSVTKEQLYSTASYQAKDLRGIQLTTSDDLADWDFSGQDLTNARIGILTNANLTGAVVAVAGLSGITKEQLYSTASYQAKDLHGIGLVGNLTGCDFSGQNLTGADLSGATLTNANLTGALVPGASLPNATFAQLYSTASYQAKDLHGMGFVSSDLTSWDFSGQNLTDGNFFSANLTNADLARAILTGADLSHATLVNANLTGAVVTGTDFRFSRGITEERLYSTASYQAKDLHGIQLRQDFTGWDFSGQNLANSNFTLSTLVNTNFTGAIVVGAGFVETTSTGFMKEQLYSTASYQLKDLDGIVLSYNDLSDWDFSGQNVANANFHQSTLVNADLTAADARGAVGLNVTGAITVNLIRPDGTIEGLDLSAGKTLVIRDDDGLTGSEHKYSPFPREPIPVRVADHLQMTEGSALLLRFEADAWDSLISFDPGIPVGLGGTLDLTFADDVDVATQLGRTLHIFDWTSVEPAGAFNVASAYLWDLTNLYSTGDVRLTGSGAQGDMDGSGMVDQGDLDLVLLNWGSELLDAPSAGWVNDLPIGSVDQDELDRVLLNWGATSGNPAGAAVPEPSTRAIAVLFLVLVIKPPTRWGCKQRRSSLTCRRD